MTKRVHGNYLLLVGPLRERTYVGCRFRVGKIRSEKNISLGGYGVSESLERSQVVFMNTHPNLPSILDDAGTRDSKIGFR